MEDTIHERISTGMILLGITIIILVAPIVSNEYLNMGLKASNIFQYYGTCLSIVSSGGFAIYVSNKNARQAEINRNKGEYIKDLREIMVNLNDLSRGNQWDDVDRLMPNDIEKVINYFLVEDENGNESIKSYSKIGIIVETLPKNKKHSFNIFDSEFNKALEFLSNLKQEHKKDPKKYAMEDRLIEIKEHIAIINKKNKFIFDTIQKEISQYYRI